MSGASRTSEADRSETSRTSRTMLVLCHDWPVVAVTRVEGIPATEPIAVIRANRIVACSVTARANGVAVGLRKRDAQGRCPQLVLVEHSPGRDAAAFEPVVETVEDMAAGVAILRPGACAFAARGPAGYFGGEEHAAERILDRLAADCDVEATIGIGDGLFTAGVAASTGAVVPAGHSREFLRDLPIVALGRPELVDLLLRLGIRTLGGFADLPAQRVLARFGMDAAMAHRLASGLDDRPLLVRSPPQDLTVEQVFDEPIDRIDTGAFAGRTLAERLDERLNRHGLACTGLEISAVTVDGRELHRLWRHDGVLSATAVADRTRWQLEGWLVRRRLTSGVVAIRLAPHGVLHQLGLQPGLWGEAGDGRQRAHRAMHRVQGMLGPDSVVTGVIGGGRDPAAMVTVVPWGDPRVPARPRGPWPGAMGAPYPALLHPDPLPAQLVDGTGATVGVSARLAMSGQPASIRIEAGDRVGVTSWFGPWPVDERWWDQQTAVRAVYLQVLLDDGTAHLLCLAGGQWRVMGSFD